MIDETVMVPEYTTKVVKLAYFWRCLGVFCFFGLHFSDGRYPWWNLQPSINSTQFDQDFFPKESYSTFVSHRYHNAFTNDRQDR